MRATPGRTLVLAVILVCGNWGISLIQAGQRKPIVALAAGSTIFEYRTSWAPAALECGSLLPLFGRILSKGDAFTLTSAESGGEPPHSKVASRPMQDQPWDSLWISSSQEKSARRPSFEAATVKPSSSKTYIPGGPVGAGDYFAWRATTLKRLVWIAYFAREWQMDWQVKGGTPGWVDSELWDVEGRAKAEDVDVDQVLQYYPRQGKDDIGRISRDKLAQEVRLWLMVQSLLEDRFKIRFERKTREAPVYNLVVAKGGPKIKLDEDQSPLPPPGSGTRPPSTPGLAVQRGTISVRGGTRPPFETSIEGRAVPIERLTSNLLNQAGRPIIDCTNLKGLYTFKIQWAEEDFGTGNSPLAPRNHTLGPGFFRALEEQLGLRLESAKGPIEFLVITNVEKPTEK